MSTRKTKMTMDEHREMGAYLAGVKEQLIHRYVKIYNSKPKHDSRCGKVCRALKNATDALDKARSELEEMMLEDYPEEMTTRSAWNFVYYPSSQD